MFIEETIIMICSQLYYLTHLYPLYVRSIFLNYLFYNYVKIIFLYVI